MYNDKKFYMIIDIHGIEIILSNLTSNTSISILLKIAAYYFSINKLDQAKEFYLQIKSFNENFYHKEKRIYHIMKNFFKRLTLSDISIREYLNDIFSNKKIYPFIPEVHGVESKDNNLILIFKETCPSCRTEILFSKTSHIIPFASKEENIWYCPACFARRLYDPEIIRKILWDYFQKFVDFSLQSCNGILTDEYACQIIVLADLLYPLAPIRFGRLWTEAMGHLSQNPQYYIHAKAAKITSPSLDYIGINYDKFISNKYLAEKWRQVLPISPIASQIFELVDHSHLAIRELTSRHHDLYYDRTGILQKASPPFSFTLDEHIKAYKHLEQMGIPTDAKFVCLHVRTEDYQKNVHSHVYSQKTSSRNADIDTYKLAAEYLTSKDYYIIRTGLNVKELSWRNERIIDYASYYRNDFMDVWLFANCDLCISTGSGPDFLAKYFNRPWLITNYYQPVTYEMSFFWGATFLPKTLIFEESGRRVTCREAASLKLIEYGQGSLLSYGIRTIDNTPEELLQAVKEKLRLINGSWIEDKMVESLQDRHLNLCISTLHFYSKQQRAQMLHKHRQYRGYARRTRISSCYLIADYQEELYRRKNKITQ